MSLLPGPDGVFREERARPVGASPEVLWSCVAELGGEPGWYAANALWAVRSRLDRLLGGPGLRGRPDRPLRVGDPVDGWRVHSLEEGVALTLASEHRMPGYALMTYEVVAGAGPDSSVLVHRVEWHPDGLRGRLMWWLELPAHVPVMSSMVRGLGRAAEQGHAATVGARG